MKKEKQCENDCSDYIVGGFMLCILCITLFFLGIYVFNSLERGNEAYKLLNLCSENTQYTRDEFGKCLSDHTEYNYDFKHAK